MKKFIAITLSLISIFLISISNGQDDFYKKETQKDTKIIALIGLNGKNEKVKIIPEYEKHILKIACAKDTIRLTEYWSVPPEVSVLNKNFIKIEYAVRGGTGSAAKNVMIICVNGSRLYEAVHVFLSRTWHGMGTNGDYTIKLRLNGDRKSNYKLIVDIHDSVYSKPNPEESYTYNNQTILSFDENSNVFYSIKDFIGPHTIIAKTGKRTKQNGINVPIIILGAETYYAIKNRWYILGNNNVMQEIWN
jgi:hypothetical protein